MEITTGNPSELTHRDSSSAVEKAPKSWAFSQLPGLNPVFLDYIERFDRLGDFFAVDYRRLHNRWEETSEWKNTVKEDLVEGLLQDARRWESRKKTIENIEALRDPDTLAVVTGQQVGIFGGPLLTFYKALSAILWAENLSRATGRKAVPVFWMETSDHDFFEINSIRMLDIEGKETALALTNAPSEKRRIVGSILLNGEIEQLLRRLYHLLPANSYRGFFFELLSSCYRPDVTFGEAFGKLFSQIFAEDGLILFDAENPRCKRAAVPLLKRILTSTEQLNDLLEKSTDAVKRKGYMPQIKPQADRMQLFIKEGDIRIPLGVDGSILYDDRKPVKLEKKKLLQLASEEPERFLPKVSLRPMMQDYLFPTAAYLAGPSEIAYFAQLKPLYHHLEVRMPAIIPRLSLTLLEKKVTKIFDRFNFTPEELSRGSQALIDHYLETDSNNDLVGLFAEARKKWEQIHDLLNAGLTRIDPTLEHPVEKTLSRCQQGLLVLEDKARTALERKNETTVSQIRKLCIHLFPNGVLQERRYGLPYYFSRYGRSLFQKIRRQAQLDLFRHQLIELGDEN
jgi:bacillithiol biosynthesis cysteine-adding enzyme BshC